MRKKTFDSRKEQIIFTALDIISEEGAKNLTMKKIADRIGISDAAAVNIPVEEMFGKAWRQVLAQSRKRKVFFGTDLAEGVRAATLATLLGYKNVAALNGGLAGFTQTILNAKLPERELTRDEEDTYRFRLKAAPQIAALIKERDTPKLTEKKVKKIEGGCGS